MSDHSRPMTAWTPLIHLLVKKSFCEEEMIKYTPFLHCHTDFGSTPLHFAALRKDPRFLLFLLGQGLPIDSPNFYDETALHWAVKQGHEEVVTLLISRGANTSKLDSERKSPKDWALEEGHKHLLHLLYPSNTRKRALPSPHTRVPTHSPLRHSPSLCTH